MTNAATLHSSSPLTLTGRVVGSVARAGLTLAGRAVDTLAPSAPPTMRHLTIDPRG